MRIGLIADTHIPEACTRLPDSVLEAFREVDLVMHAGDVYVNRVLDELARIAPVIAALGNGDEGLDGTIATGSIPMNGCARRICSKSQGLRIGLAHAMPTPDETSRAGVSQRDGAPFRRPGGHARAGPQPSAKASCVTATRWWSIRAARRCRATWRIVPGRSRFWKSCRGPPRPKSSIWLGAPSAEFSHCRRVHWTQELRHAFPQA